MWYVQVNFQPTEVLNMVKSSNQVDFTGQLQALLVHGGHKSAFWLYSFLSFFLSPFSPFFWLVFPDWFLSSALFFIFFAKFSFAWFLISPHFCFFFSSPLFVSIFSLLFFWSPLFSPFRKIIDGGLLFSVAVQTGNRDPCKEWNSNTTPQAGDQVSVSVCVCVGGGEVRVHDGMCVQGVMVVMLT